VPLLRRAFCKGLSAARRAVIYKIIEICPWIVLYLLDLKAKRYFALLLQEEYGGAEILQYTEQ